MAVDLGLDPESVLSAAVAELEVVLLVRTALACLAALAEHLVLGLAQVLGLVLQARICCLDHWVHPKKTAVAAVVLKCLDYRADHLDHAQFLDLLRSADEAWAGQAVADVAELVPAVVSPLSRDVGDLALV